MHSVATTHPDVLATLFAKLVRLYSEMQREAPDWGDAALPRSGDEEGTTKKKRKK